MEAREIYEEGLQIPLTKLSDAGEDNDLLIQIIRTNVRTPDQTMGDIWAQAGAGGLMAVRLLNMMEDYSLDDLEDLADELFLLLRGCHVRCHRQCARRDLSLHHGNGRHGHSFSIRGCIDGRRQIYRR